MSPQPPLPNEDADFDPEEIEAAANETRIETTPPELDPQTENLTKWDEPPASSGTAAPKIEPDDEASIAEQLVSDGADEADRVSRLAAADPDFQP